MNLKKTMDKLCTPAYLYFLISAIMYVFLLVQNLLSKDKLNYCAGSFTCQVSSVSVIFLLKALYIVFWTFVLNALCDYGFKKLSWFIFLLPYLLLAVLVGFLMVDKM